MPFAAVATLVAAALAVPSPCTAQDPPPETLYQSLQWRCIGPFRGGRCTAVCGVAGDPLTYYLGACGGGLWKTTDAGTTWNNVTDGHVESGSVGAVAVAPSDPNVVWLGMGESPIRGVTTSSGDGVYRSTDAGRSWAHLGLERTRQISAIRIHPKDPDVCWVAAQGNPYVPTAERGVYRTRDGGRSWELVLHVGESVGASGLTVDPGNPRVLYAAMWDHQRTPWHVRSGGPQSSIHKTTDGGDTWSRLDEGLPELMGKIGIALSPPRPDRVWAIVEAEDGGLFRSDDAGASWKRVNEERVLRARAWYYMHVFADPVDADTVYVLNAPMMKSIDGGTGFTRVDTPHGDNHDLWIAPEDNRRMINGNDGGANVSFNGGATWSTQANQPTAQFYRVITDARFPYSVYAGQQDNSTVAIQSRTAQNGIGREHWHPVGGGESAFVAFDPADPRLVYAGVYQGIITEYDVATGTARNIMANPVLGLGTTPREQPFRFNWNAPIVASPHDPETIYHAANVVLRTRDGGHSWEPISEDLTRDEPHRQGPGGGPITNEGAGGEVYNTIAYLACSPHEPDTIWTGSDCGLVHVTRDGGDRWDDVTPDGVGEALINAIDVSPHDRATAWLAVTRYKFGDFTPHVFVTRDWGETWERRVDGLPAEAFVRVVREDPECRGLLYCGTELGAFVSFDAGRHWRSLQQNLPVVPITDLSVRDGDLVASTQGRAFWILDDLSPLRQLAGGDRVAIAEADLFLLEPRDAVRFGGGGWREPPQGRGQNPPPGAILSYVVGADFDAAATPLRLEILDGAGRVLRTLASDAEPDDPGPGGGRRGPQSPPRRLRTEPGLNRAVWDLRVEDIAEIDGQHHFGSRRGYTVAPGRYTVRISAGATVLTRELTVHDDPRLAATRSAQGFAHQTELLRGLWETADAIHRAVVRVRDVREQVATLTERHGKRAEIAEHGESLIDALTAWEEHVVQTRQETFQDVINFQNRLNAEVLDILSKIDGAGPPVTVGAEQRAGELRARWAERERELERLLDQRVPAFNALFDELGLPAVRVSSRRGA